MTAAVLACSRAGAFSRVFAETATDPAGHSSITMTMDTYGHWLPTDEDEFHAKFAADELKICAAGSAG